MVGTNPSRTSLVREQGEKLQMIWSKITALPVYEKGNRRWATKTRRCRRIKEVCTFVESYITMIQSVLCIGNTCCSLLPCIFKKLCHLISFYGCFHVCDTVQVSEDKFTDKFGQNFLQFPQYRRVASVRAFQRRSHPLMAEVPPMKNHVARETF